MPITEQELADLTAKVQAGNYAEDPNIQALNKIFKIRTPVEDQTVLESYHTSKKSEITSEFATNIEKDIFESTGIEKKPGEKYYEYAKRAGSGLKSELETLRAAKSGTEADRTRIQELADLLKTKDTEKENAISELTGKFASKEIENSFNLAFNKIETKLKPIDPTIKKDVLTARKFTFEQTYKAEFTPEGNVIYKDKEGKTVLGKDYLPANTEYVVNEFYKDLLDTGQQQNGAGGTGGQQQDKVISNDPGTPPAEVNTLSKLDDWLKKNNFKSGSKEYIEAFNKYKGDMPRK